MSKTQAPYSSTYGETSVEAFSNIVLFLGKYLIRNHESALFKEFFFSIMASDLKIMACDVAGKNPDSIVRFFFREAVDHYALGCLVPLFVFNRGEIMLFKADIAQYGHYCTKEGDDASVRVNLATIQATSMLKRNLVALTKERGKSSGTGSNTLTTVEISVWLRSAPTHLVDETVSLILEHRLLHLHHLACPPRQFQ